MSPDDVVHKLLSELIHLKVVKEKDDEIVWEYLTYAYGAGYDEGRKQPKKRRQVAQYSLDGKPIKVWEV
jgi:hypothetical protein